MSRWSWFLAETLSTRLWVRASLYGLVAVITALAALYLKRYIPADLSQRIGAEAVDSILNIMAASMLSVTIFSLSTMVSAYGAASSNVTPRATKLLIEDKTSHAALSTFIGAFIFSLVGLIALHTGSYGDSGRLVLFLVTIGVIVMVLVKLLRWIDYLARLGRVGETIERVEEAAIAALDWRLRLPYLGGNKLDDLSQIPAGAIPVYAGIIGYVQHIDMVRLSHLAEDHALAVYIVAPPGKFIDRFMPLAYVSGTVDETVLGHIHKAFVTGDERAFRQDPRYGIAVLCEIATRALSPATNDTGTPIYVLGVGVRVLSLWAKRKELAGPDAAVTFPRIHVPPLRIGDLFDDFFSPIARDSGNCLEVHLRLQKAFAALVRTGDSDLVSNARYHAGLAMKRAAATLTLDEDRQRLERLYERLQKDERIVPAAEA